MGFQNLLGVGSLVVVKIMGSDDPAGVAVAWTLLKMIGVGATPLPRVPPGCSSASSGTTLREGHSVIGS